MRSRSIPLYPAACSNFKQREAQYGARASIFSFLDLHLTQVSTKENFNMTTLSYSVTEPALRSPVEEWQPHAKQSESTTEWWNVTGLVDDTAGNPYFLACCPFHFSAAEWQPRSPRLPRN